MLDLDETSKCVRCGLCLNACPTFRLLGEEMDSPRGRIYQVAQVAAGNLALDRNVALHLDRCLDCRACETACPSGVRYGHILESARAELAAQHPPPWWQQWWQRALLHSLVPHPRRRRAATALLRLAQATGLDRLAGAPARLAPRIAARPFREHGRTVPAQGTRRARVIFLPGCVQCELLPELNRATVRVLRAHGCEVVIPAFGCCGALHQHTGDANFARHLAEQNQAAVAPLSADAVVTNAAGCGARLKEYLPRTRDFSEFLDDLGLLRQHLGPLPAVATYQDACHLAHAQRIRSAPRRLLAQVPALELREMERSDQCCGSAGVYNLTQPAIARALLTDRVAAFHATGATLLVTANPGCSLQLASALGADAVLHVAEVLDRALAAAPANRA